jgi:Copper binding periplasmic protein CusF
MKTARFIAIGAVALSAGAALAQQNLTGTLTLIDRPDRNVVIQRTPDGTVGTNGGVKDVLKVPPEMSLDSVHVGDKVAYTATEKGGVKIVTKLEKQKE